MSIYCSDSEKAPPWSLHSFPISIFIPRKVFKAPEPFCMNLSNSNNTWTLIFTLEVGSLDQFIVHQNIGSSLYAEKQRVHWRSFCPSLTHPWAPNSGDIAARWSVSNNGQCEDVNETKAGTELYVLPLVFVLIYLWKSLDHSWGWCGTPSLGKLFILKFLLVRCSNLSVKNMLCFYK